MGEHYFTQEPQSKHELIQFHVTLHGEEFVFQTDAGVFSKSGIDLGTRLLIDSLPVTPGQRVLDIGCGYGPIGITAARLVTSTGFVDMIDINERAVNLAKTNLALNKITNAEVWQSDGFESVVHLYDWIISNPPIRAGKRVVYPMIEQSFVYCKTGGGLMLVIRTKQGAKSMENKMQQVFKNVQIVNIKGGYRVLVSIKIE